MNHHYMWHDNYFHDHYMLLSIGGFIVFVLAAILTVKLINCFRSRKVNRK